MSVHRQPMTLEEYQQKAMRTRGEYYTQGDQLMCACLGLAGESGEFMEHVLKHEADKDMYIKELGDVLWYIALTANAYSVNLSDVVRNYSDSIHWSQDDIFLSALEEFVVGQKKESMMVSHCAMGISIQCSSICDSVKKAVYHQHNLMLENLNKSLYEMLTQMIYVCDLLEISFEEVADANIQKLKKRYPDGFSPELSKEREEYKK